MLHISSPFLMGCCFSTLETDFDECQASDLNECHEKAKCTNTLGSYNCTCLDGYFGDGVLCQGVFWYQSGVITVLWYSRVNVVEKFSSLWEVMIKKGLEIKDLPLTIWLFIQEWTTWPVNMTRDNLVPGVFVPLDQRSENESSGSNHFEITRR